MMHSLATPARQRTSQSRAPPSTQSRAPSSVQSRRAPQNINVPELPPYEAPEGPLNAESQRQLLQLINSREYRQLEVNLKHAAEKLTESAGQVNDRILDARIRFEKAKEKKRSQKTDENDEEHDDAYDETDETEELERLGDMERRTAALTGQMEEKMRQVIDSETGLHTLKQCIRQIEREEGEAQPASMEPRRTRAQERRQRAEDEEEDGEDHEDENDEVPEEERRIPLNQRLDEFLQEETRKRNAQSLTSRYASDNSYIGFYRVVHDAKFPNDEAPPVPHSSTWFAHLENPNAASASQMTQAREPSAESDDDIAIERERISLKCPLTLLPFRDPVTSTKCPHSFERTAISDMIARSNMSVPTEPGRGGRRVRVVKCPECNTPLSMDDLRSDPVLLRRVRRAEELAAREAEDQLERQSQTPSRPNHVTLASDAIGPDDSDVDVDMADSTPAPSARVKPEPMERTMRSDSDEEMSHDEEEEEE
ncbi:hypothetical protein N7540_004099 [Penicillium herquei]|nr:hypothetical protein N7540_004099 [Penicillium herquei]